MSMNLMFLLHELNIYKPFRFTTVHAFSCLKIVNFQWCFLNRTGYNCDQEISKLSVLIRCLENYRHTKTMKT